MREGSRRERGTDEREVRCARDARPARVRIRARGGVALTAGLERYSSAGSGSLSVTRGETPPYELCVRGVFGPGLPLSTAWQTARETGAVSEMPYALGLALGRVYEQQARYRALGDALTHAINVDYQREGIEAYMRRRCAHFITLETDFANREGVLVQVYRKALRELPADPARVVARGR